MKNGNECKVMSARALLGGYADLLRENDIQIQRLEALTGRQRPTSNQQSRISELESEIKAGIALEKEKGASMEALVDKLDKTEHRAIIRMRYFDLLAWWDIVYALYGDDADYEKNKLKHQNTTFKHHDRAMKKLDLLLASQSES